VTQVRRRPQQANSTLSVFAPTKAGRSLNMVAMLWSVRASVKPMPECSPCLLSCGAPFPRLLDSTPNYVEVTAVLTVALIARLLYLPDIWKASPQPCVVVALFVSVSLYVCVDRGRLFTYFGWAKPPRLVSWLYALLGGVLAAVGVLSVERVAHMSLGAASRERLLYGVTLGSILEEDFFRGAAFSVIM
jgi:hypothetical protein